MYRLKLDKDQKISSYEVWADSGAAYLARRNEISVRSLRIVLVTYEFTYSPFSGNGILARSISKALLQLGCQVTVWCCKPHQEHAGEDNHLKPPEISQHACEAFHTIIPVELRCTDRWRKLDEESGWEHFQFMNVELKAQEVLREAVAKADVLIGVDWTGAHAIRSLKNVDKPIVYMNFRVYSSGISDPKRRAWFDHMERLALQGASRIVALSESDRSSLQSIAGSRHYEIEIVLPPLRGDIHEIAKQSEDELTKLLPRDIVATIPERRIRKRSILACVVRLSPEKNAMRFVRFVERSKPTLDELGIIPLLAGSAADLAYSEKVRQQLKSAAPNSIVVSSFLSSASLAAIFSRTCLNFHPCAYDAYGMTIVEAAACGAPSVLAAGGKVGAAALIGKESSLEVNMEEDSDDMSMESIESISRLLRDEATLEALGRKAQTKALEWDELAYGRRMIQIISELTTHNS